MMLVTFLVQFEVDAWFGPPVDDKRTDDCCREVKYKEEYKDTINMIETASSTPYLLLSASYPLAEVFAYIPG